MASLTDALEAAGEFTAYLAPEGFEAQLEAELVGIIARFERLFIARGPTQPAYWSQNIWHAPQLLRIASIGDAAKQLRALQRSWWPYAFHLHRRTELLQAKLPHVSAKPLVFPDPPKNAALGSWTLLADELLLAAPHCSSPFPNGEPHFQEYKEGPPSRAYLKLFEALTRLGVKPGPGDSCLDMGACPGGWTWVLAQLGAQVTAIDRSPLDPAVAAMPGVSVRTGDAFAAKPDQIGRIDWLFSDVICYPDRLYEHVQLWLQSGLCRNFVCTLKFQGQDHEEHYEMISRFAAIPGSRLMHLFHNKHELTWALIST